MREKNGQIPERQAYFPDIELSWPEPPQPLRSDELWRKFEDLIGYVL